MSLITGSWAGWGGEMAQAASPTIAEPHAATPKVREDLLIEPREFAGQACYVIEDPLCGRFFRIGLPEYELLRRLDGKLTIAQAVGQAASAIGREALSPQQGLAVCRWLTENNLLAGASASGPHKKPLWQRFNPLVIKAPLVNPDRLLAAALPSFAWLFSRGFAVVWASACIVALYLASLHAHELAASSRTVLDPDNWWRLLGVWLALKVVHESAHGLACKHFGGQVTRAGVMFILLAPVAYVDVTSSWRFANKWQRIITAAAGMYVELLVAACALIAWTQLGGGLPRRLAFDLALMASAGTLLVNINPLMRFDGYFILADLLGIPNLHACGQQWLSLRVQRLLGLEPANPNWPARSRWIIPLFACAAMLWRMFVYLSITLALVGFLSYAGGLLAAVLLLWVGGPSAWQSCKRLRAAAVGQSQVPRRLAALGVAACSLLLIAGMGLLRPAWISAPAVVEYAPLIVIRCASPGFVDQVHVKGGEHVSEGQPLLTLQDEELQIELNDLAVAIEQSRLRARLHQQADELPKYQAELANRDSLEKKRAEVQRRVDSLIIRAPAAGRLISRSFDWLPGQYLQAGDEVAVLGSENSKELLVAVDQQDLDLFRGQTGPQRNVQVSDNRCARFDAPLAPLEPRASQEPPHPALLATAGGPLAAIPRGEEERSANDLPDHKLLTPCFTGRVPLSPAESRALLCGQLLQVGFRSREETIAHRAWRTLQQWVGDQIASQRSAK